MTPLHEAAIQGDLPKIDEYIKRGIPVNKPDQAGNTPLHYAYYHGQQAAIERLTAYGADLTLRNKEGDTPLDMQKIAQAEGLIDAAVKCMDAEGNWTDSGRAYTLYTSLRDMEAMIGVKALVRKVLPAENRLRVLFLAVKLGIAQSEERLNDVLQAYGDKCMAEDFLNSGSPLLYEGGRRWCNEHGYTISTGQGSHRTGWGQF